MAKLPKEKSIGLLQRATDRVREIKAAKNPSVPEMERWIRDARLSVTNIFGAGTSHAVEFENALKFYTGLSEAVTLETRILYFKSISEKLGALLESMAQEIEDFWPDKPPQYLGPIISPDPSPAGAVEPSNDPSNKDVFVIHGHDHGTKDSVVLFLTKLGLNPIVLHEQANRGRSVIEKFEDYASVTYAVALLTPDDVGEAKAKADKLRPRPRQNVLFEFGYFIGRLGRTHVCGVMKGDVEIPSDYSGVLLISLDDSSWKMELLKELRAAKLPINVDAVLGG